MRRQAHVLVGSLALAASSLAQTSPQSTPPMIPPAGLGVSQDFEPVQGSVQFAGIYHVATGTWTQPRGNQANVGPDVVYNNSIGSGFFFNQNTPANVGLSFFGTGNVPTIANGGTFATAPDRTSYTINAFEFEYCDYNTTPNTAAFTFTFYESGKPCEDPLAAPVATFTVPNLPTFGCWSVTFDLTGVEFCLEGDGGAQNPGWQNDDPRLDSFAYAIEWVGSGPNQAGPMMAGDPDVDEPGYDALNPNASPQCNPAFCPPAPLSRGGLGTYFNPAPGLCNLPGATMGLAAVRSTGRLATDYYFVTDFDLQRNPGVPVLLGFARARGRGW
jgi:hypothetical protein